MATFHTEIETPVGPLLLVGDGDSLREIRFLRDGERPGVDDGEPSTSPFAEPIRQLRAYFARDLREFDLSLAPRGTSFQLRVWRALRDIPYGTTTTYADVVRRIGRPTACRAVGAANGRNPLPIVVPCHRVVGSDGTLTGYGGGLPAKRLLLALERESS